MKIDSISLAILSLVGFLFILKTSIDGEKRKVCQDLLDLGKSEINVSWAGFYMANMLSYEHVKWGSLFRVQYKSIDGKYFKGRCVVYKYNIFSGLEIKWLDKF
jgi:hypothetical protein